MTLLERLLKEVTIDGATGKVAFYDRAGDLVYEDQFMDPDGSGIETWTPEEFLGQIAPEYERVLLCEVDF